MFWVVCIEGVESGKIKKSSEYDQVASRVYLVDVRRRDPHLIARQHKRSTPPGGSSLTEKSAQRAKKVDVIRRAVASLAPHSQPAPAAYSRITDVSRWKVVTQLCSCDLLGPMLQ